VIPVLIWTLSSSLGLGAETSQTPLDSGADVEGPPPEREASLPLVMVGILARNAAHALPNFLGYLESQDYPKRRTAVW